MYFFVRMIRLIVAEETFSVHFWKFFLVQYDLVLRRSNCSKAALQARQVVLTFKIILAVEGPDPCSGLLLRGLSRGALQDGQEALPAEKPDAWERVIIPIFRDIVENSV